MAVRMDWTRWLVPVAVVLTAIPVGVLAGVNPRLAIGAALALAFLLIAFSDLSLGLAVFAFASAIELVPFGLNDALARLALAMAWLAVIVTRRRRELEFYSVHPWITLAFALFAGWALLSAVWADRPSMATLSAERYALDIILLLIVFTAVQTRADVGRVAIAMLLGATTAAVYGLATQTGVEEGRLETTLLDPNLLAASLIAGTALAVAVWAMYRSPLVRMLAAAAGTFCVVALFLTASRGGLTAFIICLLAAILVAGRWRAQVAVVAVAIAVAGYGYFAYLASDEVRERIDKPTRGEARVQEGRTTLWNVAWRAFEANPVHGVGAGNFRVSARNFLLQPGVLGRTDLIIEDPKVVHNIYLEILTELGIVGLVLFAFAALACLGAALRAARVWAALGSSGMQLAALAVAIALLGILAANFFISDQYGKPLWLMLGLGPALLSIARADAASAESAAPSRRYRPASAAPARA